MERIDKIISNELNIARSDAKSLIRSGKVFVNGVCEKSSSRKLNEEKDILNVNGKEIRFRRFVYIMMNKPKGVISSTDGRKTNEKTVVDIVFYREKVGIEETREILVTYLRRMDRNLNRLLKYAELMKCDKVMRQYLEVLV